MPGSGNIQGKVTILYSGSVGDLSSNAPVKAMSSQGDNIRIIDNTEAAKFLESDPFKLSAAKALNVQIESFVVRGSDLNKFFSDATTGAWAQTSTRFAADASGNVLTISPLSDGTRVMASDEIPAIFANSKVTRAC